MLNTDMFWTSRWSLVLGSMFYMAYGKHYVNSYVFVWMFFGSAFSPSFPLIARVRNSGYLYMLNMKVDNLCILGFNLWFLIFISLGVKALTLYQLFEIDTGLIGYMLMQVGELSFGFKDCLSLFAFGWMCFLT